MTQPFSHPRPATLTDVAKLAGVSIATASKAVNNRDQVSPVTRDRVLRAAEQLSFSPNALARGPLAGRTGTIGLLTNDLDGRFSIPILMGAEDAAGKGSVSVFLCDARDDPNREQHHVRALLGRRVDGLIVVGSRTDPRPPLQGRVPVPVVYAYARSESKQDMSVVCDDRAAARKAIEHLLALGRKQIALIAGDPDYAATKDRTEGAVSALRAAGLSPVGSHVLFGTWSEAWGRAAIASVLDTHPGLDGVLCGNDQIARGVLDGLRERGKVVPRDVAVVGFDNWTLLAENARPQLTSVDPRLETIGRMAAHRLFEAMRGKPQPGTQRIDCALVVRESTMP